MAQAGGEEGGGEEDAGDEDNRGGPLRRCRGTM